MARSNTIPLAGIIEKEKLHETETNFVDWFRNVRIVLKGAKKEYFLEATIGQHPGPDASEASRDLWDKLHDDYIAVQSAILVAMEPKLQKRFENWGPFERI